MKGFLLQSVLLLAATPLALKAEELPIVFAHSGQRATIPVGGKDKGGSITLWAFGQQWGKSIEIKNGAVEVIAPDVRVPIVFRVMPDGGKDILIEFVVYPDARIIWDKDTQLIAIAVPEWFRSWSEAVGLPVQNFKELELLGNGTWRHTGKQALLILGDQAVQKDLADMFRLADQYKSNVLVLESDWWKRNESSTTDFILSSKSCMGPLADLEEAKWGVSPRFHQKSLSLLNRQSWIAGPEHPFVEEIRDLKPGIEVLRTVFNYLPWQEQLGRSEAADQLFLRLLSETAKGAPGRLPLYGRWHLVYPTVEDIESNQHPVLAAALTSQISEIDDGLNPREIQAYVLDIRGKAMPPADFFDTPQIKAIEAASAPIRRC